MWLYQEHFFSESSGQIGYIQERLKRVRRTLGADELQRPRKKQTPSATTSADETRGTMRFPCTISFKKKNTAA